MIEQPVHHPSFAVRSDQPLLGVITQDNGQEVVHYFTDEPRRSAQDPRVQRALLLAGAWGDVDWEQTAEDLDRIRHESKPTPPIDLDL